MGRLGRRCRRRRGRLGRRAFAAAIAAARRGSEVLLLERANRLGGTTAKSSATMWIPNNPLMRAAGLRDDRAAALRYMARVAYPAEYHPASSTLGLSPLRYQLLEALYDHGSEAFAELDEAGAIPYDPDCMPGFPDYHSDFAEDEAPVGRSIRMWLPADYRFGVDATGGQRLVEAMQATAEKLGVSIRTNTRVVQVVRDDEDVVVGVEARVRTTTDVFGARQGVVFATGGFLHDPEMAAAFLRGPVFGGAAAEEATGDFVRIASGLGARLGNMGHAWWDEVVLEAALRTRSTLRDAVYLFGDSMMVVNRHGRRVMNEKMPYNERGQVHFHWDADSRRYTNLLLFLVFDEATARDTRPSRHRYPLPLGEDREVDVISGDTWAQLTDRLRDRLADLAPHTGGFTLAGDFEEGLRAQVTRFGELAATGVDLDHGRGRRASRRSGPPDPGTRVSRTRRCTPSPSRARTTA
ncbi:FAD-dependent oxidoreductase [Blastococcus sp. PRF04-17]|uniref:FAD-dependent oxidoreductase n=1 Tax=Blastococcus sp. PRF04-17 TaxID=2933797 RepID=UPI0035301C4B